MRPSGTSCRSTGSRPKERRNLATVGTTAVSDSIITAGSQITNITISGDVKSDRPTNPSGGLTRIVAGVDKDGNYEPGGNLDNFQITGNLTDSVVAASVRPYGGNGQLVPTAGPVPGAPGTYNAPAGTISGTFGSGNTVVKFPNFTAPPFSSGLDPNIDNTVLPGSINRSFAPSLTVSPPPLPRKSTVMGSVITTTPHPANADYAGIFAQDTRGVFVGVLPS